MHSIEVVPVINTYVDYGVIKEVTAVFGYIHDGTLMVPNYVKKEYGCVPDLLGRTKDFLGNFPLLEKELPLGSIVRIESHHHAFRSSFFKDLIVVEKKKNGYLLRQLTVKEDGFVDIFANEKHFRVIALGDGSIHCGIDFELTLSEKRAIAFDILEYDIAHGQYVVGGFENLATYLTALYFEQDEKIMRHIQSLVRKDGTINENRLFKVFFKLSKEQQNEIMCHVNNSTDSMMKVYEPFSGEVFSMRPPWGTHQIKWASIAEHMQVTCKEMVAHSSSLMFV